MRQLEVLAGEFAVCRLAADEAVPPWAMHGIFLSVTRTADELSIICPSAQVPSDVKQDRGWRVLKFRGPFAFTETGILASALSPLAAAKISILAIATFDTDYLLVKSEQFESTLAVLRGAGFQPWKGFIRDAQ